MFRTQCLTYLREKHNKSHVPLRGSLDIIPKVNDIILVKEPGAPQGKWSVGWIMSLNIKKSVAIVNCSGSQLTRSVNFLYPLEVSFPNSL